MATTQKITSTHKTRRAACLRADAKALGTKMAGIRFHVAPVAATGEWAVVRTIELG